MPQSGTPIDVQTLARIMETQAEMLLRLPWYPSPGFVRAARANRDLLERLRTLGDTGTYNAPTAAEMNAYDSALQTAVAEHKAHRRRAATSLGETFADDPADRTA